MAEIQSQQTQNKHSGIKRSKKLSTRVDLTPMVDLGFLLITFFVFTTSLAKAREMDLKLPDAHKPPSPILLTADKSLILILSNNKVGYYVGDDPKTMKFTSYAPSGIRGVILQRQAEVKAKYHNVDELMILIKPTDIASYQNVMVAMDEILINNVKSYMLLDATADESSICLKQ